MQTKTPNIQEPATDVTGYSDLLGRRATFVAIISPLLLFLSTQFDSQNQPYGPGMLNVRSFTASPFIQIPTVSS